MAENKKTMIIKIDDVDTDAANKIAGDVLKSKNKHAPNARGTMVIGDKGKIGNSNQKKLGGNDNGKKKK